MASNKQIRQLIKRLRKDDSPDATITELASIGEPVIEQMLSLTQYKPPVKTRAEQVIFSMPGKGADLLIKQLSSRNPHRRASAAGLLAEIGTPAALDAIRTELERDVESMRRPWRRRLDMVRHILVAVAIVWTFYMIAYIFFPSLRPKTPMFPLQLAIQNAVIAWTGITAARPARSEFRRLAAQELSKLDDPQLVNLLARLANDEEEKVRLAANEGLKRLLPSFTAEQIHGATVRELINLVPISNEVSVLALRAIARTDDERALKCIADVAADRAGHNKVLIDEARSALPVMRERISTAKQHAALLRPAVSAAEDSLLRPTANAETDSETLLRPSS